MFKLEMSNGLCGQSNCLAINESAIVLEIIQLFKGIAWHSFTETHKDQSCEYIMTPLKYLSLIEYNYLWNGVIKNLHQANQWKKRSEKSSCSPINSHIFSFFFSSLKSINRANKPFHIPFHSICFRCGKIHCPTCLILSSAITGVVDKTTNCNWLKHCWFGNLFDCLNGNILIRVLYNLPWNWAWHIQ